MALVLLRSVPTALSVVLSPLYGLLGGSFTTSIHSLSLDGALFDFVAPGLALKCAPCVLN